MNAMASRMARILASADAATALASVPIAVADPSDLPICEAGQSPEEAECTTGCPDNAPLDTQGFCTQPGTVDITGGPADVPFAPNAGADPQLPSGADPGDLYDPGGGQGGAPAAKLLLRLLRRISGSGRNKRYTRGE